MLGPRTVRSDLICSVIISLLVLSMLLPIFSPLMVIGIGGGTPVAMFSAAALFVCSTLPVLINIGVAALWQKDESSSVYRRRGA